MAARLFDYFSNLSEGLEQHHLIRSEHSPAITEVHGQDDEGEQVLYKNHDELTPVMRCALERRIINILLILGAKLDLL